MAEGFHPHEHSNGAEAGAKKDCGCGCGGNGDCEEAKKPENRARRAFLLGTGTTALATLVNHRAFAQGAVCGPLSHATSVAPSANELQHLCGGLTPGYWMTHLDVTGAVLGFTEHNNGTDQYNAHLTSWLSGTKSGSPKNLSALLPSLVTIGSPAATVTFCGALTNPGSDAWQWACAILNALSSVAPYSYNPSFGYTITELNTAILNAYNQQVSQSAILSSIITLWNGSGTDYNTNAPGGPAYFKGVCGNS